MILPVLNVQKFLLMAPSLAGGFLYTIPQEAYFNHQSINEKPESESGRLIFSHMESIPLKLTSTEQLLHIGENTSFSSFDGFAAWAENPDNFKCDEIFPNGNFDPETAGEIADLYGLTNFRLVSNSLGPTCRLTTTREPIIEEASQILRDLYTPNIIEIDDAVLAKETNPAIQFVQAKIWFGSPYIKAQNIMDAFVAAVDGTVSWTSPDSLLDEYAISLVDKLEQLSSDYFEASDFNFISRSLAITMNNYFDTEEAANILMKFAKSISIAEPQYIFGLVESTLTDIIVSTDYFGHNTFILSIAKGDTTEEIRKFTYSNNNTIQQFQESLGMFSNGSNYHLSFDDSLSVLELGLSNPQITLTKTEEAHHGRELFLSTFFWSQCSFVGFSQKNSFVLDLGPIVDAEMDICFFTKNTEQSMITSTVKKILKTDAGAVDLGTPPAKYFRVYEHVAGTACSGRKLTNLVNMETTSEKIGSTQTVKLIPILHQCDSCQQDDSKKKRSLQTRGIQETPQVAFEGSNILAGPWDPKLSLNFFVNNTVQSSAIKNSFLLQPGEKNYFINSLEDQCPSENSSPAPVNFQLYSRKTDEYISPFEFQVNNEDESFYYWLDLRSEQKLRVTEYTKRSDGKVDSATTSKYVAVRARANLDSKQLQLMEVVAAEEEPESLGEVAPKGVNIQFLGYGEASCKRHDYMSWFEGLRENIRNIVKPELIDNSLPEFNQKYKAHFETAFGTSSEVSTKKVRNCFTSVLAALDNGVPIKLDKCNGTVNSCANCLDFGGGRDPVLSLGANFDPNINNVMNKDPLEGIFSYQGVLIHELAHYFCSVVDKSYYTIVTVENGDFDRLKDKKNADSYRVYLELLVMESKNDNDEL